MAVKDSSGNDKLWSGEKQITRLVPRALMTWNKSSCPCAASGVSAIIAGEIVGEDVGVLVIRIALTSDSKVASAQKTLRIMRWPLTSVGRLLLPLPRALGPVRGHENPLPG